MQTLNKSNTDLIVKILLMVSIAFTTQIDGSNMLQKNNGENNMKDWSLGRINFTLSGQFELTGRNQNIYFVDVTTVASGNHKPNEILSNKIKLINEKNIKNSNNKSEIKVTELEPNLHAIFHQENPSTPSIVKLEAYKIIEDIILEMIFEGKSGKEKDMLRCISIISDSYLSGIPYGFNVGAG